jgi:hypothetical protein
MMQRAKESKDGIRFDEVHPWKVTPITDVSRFLRALPLLAPEGSIVYFEDTGEKHVRTVLQRLSVPATVRIAPGTILPRPDRYHVPLTSSNMEEIAAYIDKHPTGYFCGHCCVYKERKIVLAWYDAFLDDPMYISQTIDEDKVSGFASAILSNYGAT